MIEIEWILTKDVLKETANGAFSYSKKKDYIIVALIVVLCILTTLMKTKIIGYICIAIGVLSYVGRILIFYYARKKFLSSEWEKIQVLYKKDEVYYKTILEEDKMIQITENAKKQFSYNDFKGYKILENQFLLFIRGQIIAMIVVDPNSEKGKNIEKILNKKKIPNMN